MCQMNVVLKNNDRQENIMENVTRLEVTNEGILVSAFFEDPKLVRSARVKSIDFLGGTVTLDNEVSDHG